MSDKPHLDEEALAELQDVMEGEFDVLIQTYIGDSSERIAGLKAAFNAGDTDGFTKMAHSLKGSSINIGAPRLGELCHRAEMAGRAQESDQIPALLDAIDAELETVAGQLRSLVKE
jgi:HPt (histidine-containing phosphotransfer) domain-containing protein